MRRVHPFSSIFGFLATAFLLAGLAALLWRDGGIAFSPGVLSAKSQPGVTLKGFVSHADFEADCSHCHQPLKTTQDSLCLDCHTSVGEQIRRKDGTHSLIQNVTRCFACHTDHHGAEFDPTRAAFTLFDHSATHFSLLRHQVNYDAKPMECLACHQYEGKLAFSDAYCTLCHAAENMGFAIQHSQEYGAICTYCHDGGDRLADFDHQATAFPLEGKHAQARCADCHTPQELTGGRGGGLSLSQPAVPPSLCVECHAKDDPHTDMFTSDCEACHTPEGWSPARWEEAPFTHAAQAGFSLALHRQDYNGDPLTCTDCHSGNARGFDQESCISCHSQGDERAAFLSEHQGKYGRDCIACHDGVDRMADFRHEAVFPLEGRHAEITCQDCHAEQVFAGTPATCVGCHAEPDIHAGFFGLECQYCHTTQAWTPALLLQHRFPLDHGGQGEVACTDCHPGSYVEYTCYACHEHQPDETAVKHQEEGISLEELADCASCHPSGRKDED